ncbi:coiled-coil domain-containing protein [Acrasis kona]|uniref:Coiled-coil domain-containing protein n=1 Tax=Acrasis kona TaxID=1008807 RepID=A0AAW2ZQ08_9EUKA
MGRKERIGDYTIDGEYFRERVLTKNENACDSEYRNLTDCLTKPGAPEDDDDKMILCEGYYTRLSVCVQKREKEAKRDNKRLQTIKSQIIRLQKRIVKL